MSNPKEQQDELRRRVERLQNPEPPVVSLEVLKENYRAHLLRHGFTEKQIEDAIAERFDPDYLKHATLRDVVLAMNFAESLSDPFSLRES